MRYKTTKRILLFWCLFIGIGAIGGSIGMFVAPDGSAMGMQELLPYFQVLPLAEILYQNYVFPGIALLLINGIPNIIAAILLLKNKKIGIKIGTVLGITLMLWICIQFVIFPANILSISYFIFGLLQAITGYACYVFYKQETFEVKETDYKNIGKNGQEVVVYFSRLGYTKKIALETANKTGADICEITTKERTKGTLGFWWCGRFGMHNWSMPINLITMDISKYKKVTICTPVWVFTACGPVKEFCKVYKDKIKNVEYVIIHYRKNTFKKVVEELDNILNIKHKEARTICCKMGKIVYDKNIYGREPKQ